MGAAYYIVLDHGPKDFDHSVNGKEIARFSEELRQAAERLGIPGLESYYSTRPGELAEFGLDEDGEQEPPVEVVLKLRLTRDADFVYFVQDGKVQRCRRKRPGKPAAQPEIACEASFPQEEGWMYFVDQNGDVVRTPKDWRPSPEPGDPGECWFDPSEARNTFEALREYARSKGKVALVDDLGRFLEVLAEATKRKLRFHLSVDI